MRLLRVIIGTLLVVVALPMLVAGGALWGAMQHRGPDGAFSARITPVATGGYAVVAPDLDGLLHREASFTRGGQTTLSISATSRSRLFIGIGPAPDVQLYLAGRARAQLNRVRLARGTLPIDIRQLPAGTATFPTPGAGGPAAPASPTPGTPPAPLAQPATLPFWQAASHLSGGREVVTWSPSSMRGQDVSLVVMNADGTPAVDAALTATVSPGWLDPTTWGLLILGTVLFVLGSGALVWPRRHRDIVYVVEPGKLPEIAAKLGVEARGGAVTAAAVRAAHPRADEPPVPWFARVGGGLPDASSVAPSGRQQTFLSRAAADEAEANAKAEARAAAKARRKASRAAAGVSGPSTDCGSEAGRSDPALGSEAGPADPAAATGGDEPRRDESGRTGVSASRPSVATAAGTWAAAATDVRGGASPAPGRPSDDGPVPGSVPAPVSGGDPLPGDGHAVAGVPAATAQVPVDSTAERAAAWAAGDVPAPRAPLPAPDTAQYARIRPDVDRRSDQTAGTTVAPDPAQESPAAPGVEVRPAASAPGGPALGGPASGDAPPAAVATADTGPGDGVPGATDDEPLTWPPLRIEFTTPAVDAVAGGMADAGEQPRGDADAPRAGGTGPAGVRVTLDGYGTGRVTLPSGPEAGRLSPWFTGGLSSPGQERRHGGDDAHGDAYGDDARGVEPSGGPGSGDATLTHEDPAVAAT